MRSPQVAKHKTPHITHALILSHHLILTHPLLPPSILQAQTSPLFASSSSASAGLGSGSRHNSNPTPRDPYYSGNQGQGQGQGQGQNQGQSAIDSPRDLHAPMISPRDKTTDSYGKLSPRDFGLGLAHCNAKSSSFRDNNATSSSRIFVVPQAPFGSFISEASESDYNTSSNNNNNNHSQLHASFASMGPGPKSDRPGGGTLPRSSSSDSASAPYQRDMAGRI